MAELRLGRVALRISQTELARQRGVTQQRIAAIEDDPLPTSTAVTEYLAALAAAAAAS